MDHNKNGITWALSPHVRATINADGGVLLDIEKGMCYSLNPVGAKIWQAIQSRGGNATLEDIVSALVPLFTVDRNQLVQDIDEYLQDLEKKGLTKAGNPVQATRPT